MNKRIARLLRTNITIFSLCLVLFALAAIPFDVRLAIGEGVAAVAFFLLGRRRSKATQQSLRQYIQRFYGGMDSARSSNMLFTPLPMMVFDLATEDILWSSESFLQREGIFDAHLETVFPNISFHWLLEGKTEAPETVVWNHRTYRVFGGVSHPEGGRSALATTYWMDVTDTEEMRRTLELTRPVVAILMVDNYEDLMKATPEGKRSAVRAMLEEKEALLRFLLREYNDGRRKSLFCTAVNLLELADVRETVSLLRRQTPPDAALREKGALAARLLQEAAAANGICLKLNRKKK